MKRKSRKLKKWGCVGISLLLLVCPLQSATEIVVFASEQEVVEEQHVQEENSWVKELSIEDWVEGEEPSAPECESKYGEIEYIYVDGEGNQLPGKPEEAGSYTLRAVVEESDNYLGLETEIHFQIASPQIHGAEETEVLKQSVNAFATPRANVPSVGKPGDVIAIKSEWKPAVWPAISGTGIFTITYNGSQLHRSGYDINSSPGGATSIKVGGTEIYSTGNMGDGISHTLTGGYSGEFVVNVGSKIFNFGYMDARFDNAWAQPLTMSSWVWGNAAASPNSRATYGTPVYEYYSSTNQKLSGKPTDVGNYKVKGIIAETEKYRGINAEANFTISKASNAFTTAPSIAEWTYGESKKTPVGAAKFGTVKFSYSKDLNGSFGSLPATPEAGTWYLKAEVPDTANYGGLSQNVSFVVSKANDVVSFGTADNYTYTGVGQSPKATSRYGGAVTYQYKKSGQPDGSYTATEPSDVGSYVVRAASASGANWNVGTATKTYTISKSANSWKQTPAIANWIYSSTPSTPSGSPTFGSAVYTYSQSQTTGFGPLPSKPTAGTWYMKARVEDTLNYGEIEQIVPFTIQKATDIITFSPTKEWTYDASSHTPTATATSGAQITYEYKGASQPDTAYSAAVPADVGAYIVRATTHTSQNYEVKNTTANFTITKANNSWLTKPSLAAWTYGQTANKPVATARFGNIVYTYSDNPNGPFVALPSQPHAGIWYVKATVKDTNNYGGIEDTALFPIYKASDAISFGEADTWTYDGSVHVPTATAVSGAAIAYEYKVKGAPDTTYNTTKPSDAGKYTVRAKTGGDTNYNDATATYHFEIEKAQPQYTLPNLTSTYGKRLKDSSFAQQANGTFRWSDGEQLVGDVGTKTFKATFTPSDTNNYEVVHNIQVPVSVAQATNSWTTPLSIADWTYANPATEPKAVAEFGTPVYTYSETIDGIYSHWPQNQHAGSWYVKATVPETNNYTGLTETKMFRIDIAADTITFDAERTWTYDGKPHAPIALAASNTAITYEYKLKSADDSAYSGTMPHMVGDYHVRATSVGNENYHVGKEIVEFAITIADNSWVEEPSIQNWTYADTPSKAQGSSEFGTVEFSYSDTQDGTYVALPDNPHGGVWYLKAYVPATNNYKEIEKVIPFTISQVLNTWVEEPSMEGWTYGNVNKTAKGSAAFGVVNFTYSNTQGGAFAELPDKPHAGTWYLKAEVSETVSYSGLNQVVSFTVDKRQDIITFGDEDTWAYDGKEHTPSATSESAIPVSYEYKEKTEDDIKYSSNIPKDKGVYIMKATTAGNENYLPQTETKEFAITQAQNSWREKPAIENWTYGNTPNEAKGSAVFGTVEFSYSDKEEGEYKVLPKDPHGGTWYLKAYVPGTEDYKEIEEIVPFTIERKEDVIIFDTLEKRVRAIQEWVYDGLPHTLTATTESGIETTYQYKRKGEDDTHYSSTVPVDVGTYIVKAETEGNMNYLPQYSTKEFAIVRANNAWLEEPSIKGWTYAQESEKAEGSSEFGTITFSYSDSEDGVYAPLPDMPHAGTWYLKAEVEETPNYTGLSFTTPFTISQAKDVIEFSEETKWDYDGLEHTPKVSALSKSELEITYKLGSADDAEYTDTVPSDAGEYTMKVISQGNENYLPETQTLDFDINQATNEWSEEPAIEGWEVGQAAKQVKGISKFGEVKFHYSHKAEGPYTDVLKNPQAGTWYLKAEVEETDNYTGLKKIIPFTILDSAKSDSATPDAGNSTTGSVATGDTAPYMLLISCLLLSAITLIGILKKKRTR